MTTISARRGMLGNNVNKVPPCTSSNFSTRGWLAVVILLGTALRFYQLDRNSLWLDEILTLRVTDGSLEQMLERIIRYDIHPPLFYILAQQARFLGDSEFAVRLLPVFAGILCIPVMYVAGRRLWGEPGGFLASLLVAVWPAHLHYSQEARQYTLLILFWIGSMYWLYRSILDARLRSWLGYTLALVATIYTHYFAFLFVASQAVFIALAALAAFLRQRHSFRSDWVRLRILPFIASLILGAIAYVPWYPSLLQQSERLVHRAAMAHDEPALLTSYLTLFRRTMLSVAERQDLLASSLWLALLLGFTLAVIQWAWTPLLYISSSLAIPLIILGSTASLQTLYPHHFVAFLAPAILLTIPALLLLYRVGTAVLKPISRSETFTSAAHALLMIGLLTPFNWEYYQFEKEDWRGVANYLTRHKMPEDVIIGDGVFYRIGDAGRVELALSHYLKDGSAVIRAEYGAAGHLPDDLTADGTAWGVIWYQGRLADRSPLTGSIEFRDFQNLVVLKPNQPTHRAWCDTAIVLEAILELQPLQETHTDLHLALAELYTKINSLNLASYHLIDAKEVAPPNDPRVEVAMAEIQPQLVSDSTLESASEDAATANLCP